MSITNSETIRTVHNSFARADPFVNEMARPEDDNEDNFHFLAYVPVDGKIYELDGLKEGPICVGEYDASNPGNWSCSLVPAIQSRIALFGTTEIRFNLMSVIRSKRGSLSDQVCFYYFVHIRHG
jgi:ubiquitin carboxyl-terminal hydrolase L5